jgi:hypothetical protein
MGYCGPMGYGMQFPANQVGGRLELWDIRGYWVIAQKFTFLVQKESGRKTSSTTYISCRLGSSGMFAVHFMCKLTCFGDCTESHRL